MEDYWFFLEIAVVLLFIFLWKKQRWGSGMVASRVSVEWQVLDPRFESYQLETDYYFQK